MSNTEFFAKLKTQRLTSLEEDYKAEQKEILADQAHWAKYGTNRPRRGAPSKAEHRRYLKEHRTLHGLIS